MGALFGLLFRAAVLCLRAVGRVLWMVGVVTYKYVATYIAVFAVYIAGVVFALLVGLVMAAKRKRDRPPKKGA